MPIYGLTDQPASFPVVGTLFLGTPLSNDHYNCR
jgi:hypothetical protein